MAPSMVWVLVLSVTIVTLAVLLRRRYGNVYEGLKMAFERSTGWSATSIVSGLSVLTLLVWAVVYLYLGGDGQTGLDQLFEGVLGAGTGAPD